MTSVGAGEERRRDRKAELVGGFQIDNQLEAGRLLNGQLSGTCALEDSIYVRSGTPIEVGGIGSE